MATECPVCISQLNEPIFLACCGNSICCGCLSNWNRSYCPMCRGNIPDESLWVRNRTVENILAELAQNRSTLSIPSWGVQGMSEVVKPRISCCFPDFSGVKGDSVAYFGSRATFKRISKLDASTQEHLYSSARHPNIIEFYGGLDSCSSKVLLFEYCKGGTLYEAVHLRNRPFTISNTLNSLFGIISALEYLHSTCLIHGNLTASTVHLTSLAEVIYQDEVKISDFLTNQNLSISGGVSQTTCLSPTPHPAYIPPEQWAAMSASPPIISGSQVSSSSGDIYALGVIGWELLTRQEPWKNKTTSEIRESIARGDRLSFPCESSDSSPQGLNGGAEIWCRKKIQAVLSNCLSEKSGRPTASEIRLQLETIRSIWESHSSSGGSSAIPLSSLSMTLPPNPNAKQSGEIVREQGIFGSPCPASCVSGADGSEVSSLLEAIVSITLSLQSQTSAGVDSSPSSTTTIADTDQIHSLGNRLNRLLDELRMEKQQEKDARGSSSLVNMSKDISTAVLTVLRIRPCEEPGIAQLCFSILNLCLQRDPVVGAYLAETDFIRLAFEWLSKWGVWELVVQAGLACLARLCSYCPDVRDQLIYDGRSDVLIQLMKKCENSSLVTKQGCGLINKLGQSTSDSYVINRIVASNACELVTTLTATHLEDEETVEQICGTIANLSRVSCSAGKRKFEQSSVLNGILIALQRYPRNGMLASQCYSAVISAVKFHKEYRDSLVAKGIFLNISISMTMLSSNLETLPYICACVTSLCNLYTQNISTMMDANICSILFSCISEHAANTHILTHLFAVVSCLCDTNDLASQAKLVESGLCDLTIHHLQLHTADKDLVRQLIGAIVAMSNIRGSPAFKLLNKPDVTDTITRAVHVHSKDKEVVIPGLWALELIGKAKVSPAAISRFLSPN